MHAPQQKLRASALALLALTLVVGTASPALAQAPYLVRDINTTSNGAGSSTPENLTAVNDVLYFSATDSIHGNELWRTDGTSTSLVSEIRIGPESTFPQRLAKCGDFVCFTYQSELWRSDGTGAESLKVFPGPTKKPIDIDGVTFLIGAYNPDTIHRLHADGTTELLSSSPVRTLLETRSNLFFSDLDSIGYSDGSASGTQTLLTFSRIPELIGEANGTVFFKKPGPLHVVEFWRTHGSSDTTQYLATLDQPSGDRPGHGSVNINGILFFLTSPEYSNLADLWKSDGTPTGTVKVKTGFMGGFHVFPTQLTNLNGLLLFVADDGVSGRELWISDGSEGGTRILKDIFSGQAGSNPTNLTVVDGVAYFEANDGVTGSELWRTDGTAEGTKLVYDLFQGPKGSSPNELTYSGNRLYFAATTSATGRELWAYPLPEEVVISASDFVVTESSAIGSFVVSLSRPSSLAVSVRADFGNGTADLNVDYVGTSQILVFEPGEITKDFSFTILDDSLPEPDKTVVLDLSLATNARIARNQAVATLRDDDRAADLEIRAQGTGFVIFNHGPSVATDVELRLTPAVDAGCGSPCFNEIAVGAARSISLNQVSAYTGVVSSSIPDPATGNNTASGMGGTFLVVHCDHISTSGTRASLYLHGESIHEEIVTLSAVPASAVSMPSKIVVPPHVAHHDFMIEGLVEGPVTITVSRDFGSQTTTQAYSITTSVTSGDCPLSPGPCAPPVLTSVPELPKYVLSGAPFTLSVNAKGSADLHYLWSSTAVGGGYPGHIGKDWRTTLTFPETLSARVRVSNACGSTFAPVQVQSVLPEALPQRRRPAERPLP